jgi:hypothetical protein
MQRIVNILLFRNKFKVVNFLNTIKK